MADGRSDGPVQAMTMRPEGMSERQLELCRELIETDDEVTRHDDSWPLLPKGAARDLLAEVSRLRADGATLKARADEALVAHSASFGALATLSAALCDGEVDDYAALAEKVIARVRQAEDAMATLREQAGVALGGMVFEIQQALAVRPGEDTFERIAELMRAESDGATLREELVSGRAQWQQERDEYRQIVESSETALATLRERVRKLPTPVNPENDFNRQHVHVWYCRWCGESWLRNATTSDADHPNNGCLWPDVHQPASAPKEPS